MLKEAEDEEEKTLPLLSSLPPPVSACRFFKLQTKVTDPTLCSPVMVISVPLKAVSSVGPINPNIGFFLFGSVASAKKHFHFFFNQIVGNSCLINGCDFAWQTM